MPWWAATPGKYACAACWDGHLVRTFALENYRFETGILPCDSLGQAAREADCVIFPMPMTQEGRLNAPLAAQEHKPDRLLEELPAGCVVMGGMVPEGLHQAARRLGVVIHDYLKREELALMNAAITAEGAIQIAMENTERAINGSRCLVIGYGRIGTALCARLRGLGAKVTTAARRCSQLALAQCEALDTVAIQDLSKVLPRQDIIFNTAPAMVLPRPLLEKMQPQAVVIDLASKPGGADFMRHRYGTLYCSLPRHRMGTTSATSSPEISAASSYRLQTGHICTGRTRTLSPIRTLS